MAMLLRQWAYFANGDLWYELLKDSGPKTPNWLAEITKDKLTFHAGMRLLCRHGLVQANSPTALPHMQSPGYSLHRCVHFWIIHVLNQVIDEKMAWTAIECVSKRALEQDERGSWVTGRRLIAHADWCLEIMRDIQVGDEIVAVLPCFAILYSSQGRLQKAEAIYDRAVEGYEKARGEGHPATLAIIGDLGMLYREQGRFYEAGAMCERALVAYEKMWGPEHRLTLAIVHNLCLIYRDQGRLQEAEAMCDRALEGHQKIWGRDHPLTLTTIINLGFPDKDQGGLHELEVMYKQALESCEKVWGPKHPSTLKLVNAIGCLYYEDSMTRYHKLDQARLTEAEAMFERAFKGFEEIWGPEHPSTLDTVDNLGLIYTGQGRLQEAESMHQRALEGNEKVRGRENLSTISTVDSLACLYMRQGRLQDAEAMYRRALDGYEKAFGSISVWTYDPALQTLEGLGRLYEKQRRFDISLLFYQRALRGVEAVFGRSSPRYSRIASRASYIGGNTCRIL